MHDQAMVVHHVLYTNPCQRDECEKGEPNQKWMGVINACNVIAIPCRHPLHQAWCCGHSMVPTTTPVSASNDLQTASKIVTDLAAHRREDSVKFDPMLAIILFSSLLTCSF